MPALARDTLSRFLCPIELRVEPLRLEEDPGMAGGVGGGTVETDSGSTII